MMNLLNRTAVALLKVIEVETQEATKEQADAWLRLKIGRASCRERV